MNLLKLQIIQALNSVHYSIDNFGEGPGEYNYISDVTINEDLNTIDILSLNKILRFDLFGVFKEEIHLNSLLYKMMYIKDNNYIVYIPSNLHGDLLSNELSGSILFNLDPDKNTYKRLLPYYFKNNMPFMSEVNILQKFKDNFFFTMTFADTIYSFNMENFINKKYFLDFKTKRYPIELLYNNDDAISILNDKNNISKYSYHYSNLHINEKYLITNFRAKSNGVIVYNKESKEVFSGYDLINDIDKGLNKFNIKLLRDNIAYSFDQPGYILEHFEKNGNNMTKNRNNFTEMASKVDAHTSLILSKYYLK